jgi:hypothetical protein
MDVVSSTIMLITSRMAGKPKLDKYPVVSLESLGLLDDIRLIVCAWQEANGDYGNHSLLYYYDAISCGTYCEHSFILQFVLPIVSGKA